MSRIAQLRKLIATHGATVTGHYCDGPNSDTFKGKNTSDQVMYTLDLSNRLKEDAEEKMVIHLWFQPGVNRVYFTKKSHRLKVIFNCRSARGAKA